MDPYPTYVPYAEFVAMRDERDQWARMYKDLWVEFQQYKQAQDAQEEVDSPDLRIFTKKVKIEHKTKEIITSLQASMQGRKDKARALVEKVCYWQDDGYIDRFFNAQIMYEELRKCISMSFGVANFRKFYNRWSSVAN